MLGILKHERLAHLRALTLKISEDPNYAIDLLKLLEYVEFLP